MWKAVCGGAAPTQRLLPAAPIVQERLRVEVPMSRSCALDKREQQQQHQHSSSNSNSSCRSRRSRHRRRPTPSSPPPPPLLDDESLSWPCHASCCHLPTPLLPQALPVDPPPTSVFVKLHLLPQLLPSLFARQLLRRFALAAALAAPPLQRPPLPWPVRLAWTSVCSPGFTPGFIFSTFLTETALLLLKNLCYPTFWVTQIDTINILALRKVLKFC